MPRRSNDDDALEEVIRDFEQGDIPSLRPMFGILNKDFQTKVAKAIREHAAPLISRFQSDRERLNSIANLCGNVVRGNKKSTTGGGSKRSSSAGKKRSSESAESSRVKKKRRTSSNSEGRKKKATARRKKSSSNEKDETATDTSEHEEAAKPRTARQLEKIKKRRDAKEAADSRKFVVTSSFLMGLGWTIVKAAKYNPLDDWYYIRPGCTVENGLVGSDYFKSLNDVNQFFEKNSMLTDCVSRPPQDDTAQVELDAAQTCDSTANEDPGASSTENATSSSLVSAAVSPSTQPRHIDWETIQKTARKAKQKNDEARDQLERIRLKRSRLFEHEDYQEEPKSRLKQGAELRDGKDGKQKTD